MSPRIGRQRASRMTTARSDGAFIAHVAELEEPHKQRHRLTLMRLAIIGGLALFSLIGGLYLSLTGGNGTVSEGKTKISLNAEQHRMAPQECHRAPANPEDRRHDKSRLKVVNFNAEWLFLYGGRGGIKCPAESCPWRDTTDALSHMMQVGALLAELDADVIHLSEVEDCRVLQALMALIPGDHRYRPYLVTGRDHMTGQNVGMLTRVDPIMDLVRTEKRGHYPVADSTCPIKGTGSIGVTKHYVASLDVDDGRGNILPFVFVGLHLLARPADRSRCGQREAQARVLKELIQSLTKENQYIIMMGDYNDYDGTAVGIDGRHPLSNVLKTLHHSSGSGRTLRNAASLVPVSERYSCWFDMNQNCRVDGPRERVMIDHILVDAELEILEANIHHVFDPTCTDRISDHWPFSVTIKLS